MTRLCIVDIDGVVADSTARFAKAEEAKQKAIKLLESDPATWSIAKSKATDLFWRTAFTPELVTLDTLIEGTLEAVRNLWSDGWDVFFLTSRPESMRNATIEWFRVNRFPSFLVDGEKLYMKAPAFQYTKTIVWKAGMIETIAANYEAEEVLVIDDEQVNIDEIMKYAEKAPYTIRCYKSLKMEDEPEPEKNDNPF